MQIKRNVVIGWVGKSLDSGNSEKRWRKWRPTISLFEHEDFPVRRAELLFQEEFSDLMENIKEDIREISPLTRVNATRIEFHNPRSFPEVYKALYQFAVAFEYDHEKENYFLHITTGTHVSQISMFLLAESRVFPVNLIQTSPLNKVKKGVSGRLEFLDLGSSDFNRIRSRIELNEQSQKDVSFLKDGINTRNSRFNALIERIESVVVNSTEPILLLGATGAGKTKLARKIYELKLQRRQVSKDFVEVNCSTIRGDGAMSALFGHIEGSFTGAHQKRDGYLFSADKGLLFLDEIADLGLAEQAMLLRAIEEKKFMPYGSDKHRESNFQLIAGTNADLPKLVYKGRFREDLLARLEHWKFLLPGLKERPEDIEPNIDYQLRRIAAEKKLNIEFTPEARRQFIEFALSPQAIWKRNFRDLNRAIDRMATLAPRGRIGTDVVSNEIETLKESWKTTITLEKRKLVSQVLSDEECDRFDEYDLLTLEAVLSVCCTCRTLAEAAKMLFAKSLSKRSTENYSDRLSKFFKRFGLKWEQLKKINPYVSED